MCSKSPCSFPMISTTAADVASSRVNRWFSARNRAAGVRLAEALGRRRTEALAEHGGDTVDVHV